MVLWARARFASMQPQTGGTSSGWSQEYYLFLFTELGWGPETPAS